MFDQHKVLMGAAGLLLRDDKDHVLLVKPHYKQVWHLPGGLMEHGETPRQAAWRETLEETGLDVAVRRLLVVDFKSDTEDRPACVQFVFDGGYLSERQLKAIVLQPNEISAWRTAPRDEAVTLVQAGGAASRLAQTFAALDSGVTAYLEDGQPL
ncbi:NUDIX domain-containing protein [Allorhizocola rhizosphaerae]|uniref:NUDIX domain-containing protein n=1 Tax=Allorhizocola rhizosphaerae TaxID=1872709 RepID=UPI001FEBF15D|nr:NUDIX hydrolase [Allorhizocola rhizosphaerae]